MKKWSLAGGLLFLGVGGNRAYLRDMADRHIYRAAVRGLPYPRKLQPQ